MGFRRAAVDEAHRLVRNCWDWSRADDLVRPETARYCNRARAGDLMAVCRPPTRSKRKLRLSFLAIPFPRSDSISLRREKIWRDRYRSRVSYIIGQWLTIRYSLTPTGHSVQRSSSWNGVIEQPLVQLKKLFERTLNNCADIGWITGIVLDLRQFRYHTKFVHCSRRMFSFLFCSFDVSDSCLPIRKLKFN